MVALEVKLESFNDSAVIVFHLSRMRLNFWKLAGPYLPIFDIFFDSLETYQRYC